MVVNCGDARDLANLNDIQQFDLHTENYNRILNGWLYEESLEYPDPEVLW